MCSLHVSSALMQKHLEYLSSYSTTIFQASTMFGGSHGDTPLMLTGKKKLFLIIENSL